MWPNTFKMRKCMVSLMMNWSGMHNITIAIATTHGIKQDEHIGDKSL